MLCAYPGAQKSGLADHQFEMNDQPPCLNCASYTATVAADGPSRNCRDSSVMVGVVLISAPRAYARRVDGEIPLPGYRELGNNYGEQAEQGDSRIPLAPRGCLDVNIGLVTVTCG